MDITVQVKNVYGNQTIYPICEKAKLFAAMLGQKTLTTANLRSIKALGFEIKQHTTAIII